MSLSVGAASLVLPLVCVGGVGAGKGVVEWMFLGVHRTSAATFV